MRPLIHEVATGHSPESLTGQLVGEPAWWCCGARCLTRRRRDIRSWPRGRFSPSAPPARAGEIKSAGARPSTFDSRLHFGNPWNLLDSLMSRCELLDEIDLPFPLGGCFGYWGYDLKNFVEPKLPAARRTISSCPIATWVLRQPRRLRSPARQGVDCFHRPGGDGSRCEGEHKSGWNFGAACCRRSQPSPRPSPFAKGRGRSGSSVRSNPATLASAGRGTISPSPGGEGRGEADVASNFTESEFLARVERAQRYIRAGDIYQVNLSQRLTRI